MNIVDNQLKNLRRRLEHFLRQTTSENMVRIAEFVNTHMEANLKIPKLLRDKYLNRNKE